MKTTPHIFPPHPPGERAGAWILCGQVAALALARQLSRAGVRVGCADTDAEAPALFSRHCHHRLALTGRAEAGWARQLLEAAHDWRPRPVLLATSDETLLFVSRFREQLGQSFRLDLAAHELLTSLIDKRRMYELAARHGLPAPRGLPVRDEAELAAAGRELGYPCLLKSAHSKPGGRDAAQGKILADSWDELRLNYAWLRQWDDRLLVQEWIPGGCGNIVMFNGYFSAAGEPVAVFTGRKLRQFPCQSGTASLSEAFAAPEVARAMAQFLTALGYRGPVDGGMKYDPASRCFKVLDINPRLGQNYRTYHGREGVDMGWLAYSGAAGAEWPAGYSPLEMQRPCRWGMEDHDWRSARVLKSRGELRWRDWLRQWARVNERAWWDWRDLRPVAGRLCNWRRERQGASAQARAAQTPAYTRSAAAGSAEEDVQS